MSVVNAGDAVTMYGPLPVKVALSVQLVPPSLLTCRTTLATAAVGTPVPVYAVSDAVDKLNAGVRVLMIPSAPGSFVVIVRVPRVMAALSTTKAVAAVVDRVFPAVSTVATLAEMVAFCDAWTTYE